MVVITADRTSDIEYAVKALFSEWAINCFLYKGYFPLGGIFRAERHFLLFKDQLAESGRQKTKENIISRGKFRLVENDPKVSSVKG